MLWLNLVIPRRAFEIFTDKFCYINTFTQLSVSTLAHTGTLLLKIETLHPPSGKVMRNAAFSAIRAASKHIKMLQRLPNCFFFFRGTLGNLGVLGFQQAVILPDLWTEPGLTCEIYRLETLRLVVFRTYSLISSQVHLPAQR